MFSDRKSLDGKHMQSYFLIMKDECEMISWRLSNFYFSSKSESIHKWVIGMGVESKLRKLVVGKRSELNRNILSGKKWQKHAQSANWEFVE